MKTLKQIASECADKIAYLTGYGQELHPNDIKSDILKALHEAEKQTKNLWMPISTAPKETDILVRGDSGYVTYVTFYINSHYCNYKDAWVDATGERLSDAGWVPTHWMHIPQ